jgi:hypothetical protein
MTQPMTEKEKFVAKLKGEPVGKDALDNDLFVGDIILYAVSQNQSAKLKAGRITKVSDKKAVQVRTISKQYHRKTKGVSWEAGGFGTLRQCSINAVLWKDPPQEIIDKLDAAEKKPEKDNA